MRNFDHLIPAAAPDFKQRVAEAQKLARQAPTSRLAGRTMMTTQEAGREDDLRGLKRMIRDIGEEKVLAYLKRLEKSGSLWGESAEATLKEAKKEIK